MSYQMLRLNIWLSVTVNDTQSDTQLLLESINPITWLNLIHFSILFNLISFSLWYDLSKSYYLTRFNYFDLAVLHFTLTVEYGKRCPQLHSRKYDWLVPDRTKNTQGSYIPILPVVIIMLTPPGLYLNQ